MRPQTDAELTAWNYGAAIAAAPPYPSPAQLRTHEIITVALPRDAARALDTLGPDLFWTWADRGYYSHLTTPAQ